VFGGARWQVGVGRAGAGVTVVAIDGPAGAGKSTVAQAVARELGWAYVDTGAIYRAVALAALERGVDVADGAALERLASALDLKVAGEHVHLDGRDVGARIRAADVTAAATTVAAHGGVRSALARLQADLAARGDVVMEGRDIATVVVPDAEVKVYLTASLPERARRRARQLGVDRDDAALKEVAQSLEARDAADSTRAASPLARAPGALVIDSTRSSVAEVTAAIVARVREVRRGG
jgi:cytidylate kinase